MQEQGYTILEMNYRCRKGEIDIVATDGTYLCFVEVKYRKDAKTGDPLEAVGMKKQQVICYVAEYYLLMHQKYYAMQIRFDVIAICGENLTLLKNAFPYRGR